MKVRRKTDFFRFAPTLFLKEVFSDKNHPLFRVVHGPNS